LKEVVKSVLYNPNHFGKSDSFLVLAIIERETATNISTTKRLWFEYSQAELVEELVKCKGVSLNRAMGMSNMYAQYNDQLNSTFNIPKNGKSGMKQKLGWIKLKMDDPEFSEVSHIYRLLRDAVSEQ
jgi:hypothetical protein